MSGKNSDKKQSDVGVMGDVFAFTDPKAYLARTHVSGDERGKLNKGFGVKLVERTLEGTDRWDDDAYQGKTSADPLLLSNISKGQGRSTSVRWKRAPGVNAAIVAAHHRPTLDAHVKFSCFCHNPKCTNRTEKISEFERLGKVEKRNMRNLARGTVTGRKCGCKWERPPITFRPVENKWVYVFSQQTDAQNPQKTVGELQLRYEVFAADKCKWQVRKQKANGGHAMLSMKGNILKLEGTKKNGVTTYPWDYNWYFFLSPVRLGKQSQEMLRKSIAAEAVPAGKKTSRECGFQPDVTAVCRRFTRAQMEKGKVEVIPVLDPFAWAFAINQLDYRPILSAWKLLLSSAHERAREFIATTLIEAKTKRPDPKNSTYKIYNESSWKPHCGMSPKAWLKKLRRAEKYLGVKAAKSCRRLVNTLKSRAHKVVELACQEQGTKAGFLSYGLMHWNGILKEMVAHPEGKAFVTWLYGSGRDENDTPCKSFVHIPHENVLKGKDLGAGSPVADEVGKLTIAQILGHFAPLIVRKQKSPANQLAAHFQRVNIKAAVKAAQGKPGPGMPGAPEMLAFAEVGSKIADVGIERYLESAQAALGVDAREFSKRELKAEFKLLSDLGDLQVILNVLIELSSSSQAPIDEPWLQKLPKAKTPLAVAGVLLNRAAASMKKNASTEIKQIMGFIDNDIKLTALEKSSRQVRTYNGIKVAGKGLGFITGAIDLLCESDNAINAWQEGRNVRAASHLIGASGAVTSIVALLATGPVGAGLALLGVLAGIGATVVAFFQKSELELFAEHSFLRKNDNEDAHGQAPSWTGCKRWENAYSPWDDAIVQKNALMRLFTAPTIRGPSSEPRRGKDYSATPGEPDHLWSWEIRPAQFPDYSRFVVTLETWKETKTHMEFIELEIRKGDNKPRVIGGSGWGKQCKLELKRHKSQEAGVQPRLEIIWRPSSRVVKRTEDRHYAFDARLDLYKKGNGKPAVRGITAKVSGRHRDLNPKLKKAS
ncbi:MAG: hypothetical protein ACYTHJ_19915 [Planctomycetota bacterium]|jgi:hypothetical protein